MLDMNKGSHRNSNNKIKFKTQKFLGGSEWSWVLNLPFFVLVQFTFFKDDFCISINGSNVLEQCHI